MGFFVGEWLFVFPLCGFSLSLFCNYSALGNLPAAGEAETSTSVKQRPLGVPSRDSSYDSSYGQCDGVPVHKWVTVLLGKGHTLLTATYREHAA